MHLDILSHTFILKLNVGRRITSCVCSSCCVCSLRGKGRDIPYSYAVAPSYCPSLLSPAGECGTHTSVPDSTWGEVEAREALPQVTPIQVLGGALPAELHGRGALFPGCSSTLGSSHHAQSVLLILFSLLIFGPEVSFQNSSRAWK